MYPECHIVFVVNKPFTDVARYLDGVDEVWPYDKHGTDHSLYSKYKFLKKYKNRYNFDAAFIMWSNFFGTIAAKYWGTKNIYSKPFDLWQRVFLTNGTIDFKNWTHIQDKNAYLSELYSHIPIKSIKIRYHIPKNAIHYADKLIEKLSRPIILINPLTKKKIKDLPPSLVAELAYLIDQAGYIPVMLGTGMIASRYYDSLPEETKKILYDFSNRTTIPQLAAVLKKSKLLISADTGTAHLALAVDTPLAFVVYQNQSYLLEEWAPKSFYNAVTIGYEKAYKADCIWEIGKTLLKANKK